MIEADSADLRGIGLDRLSAVSISARTMPSAGCALQVIRQHALPLDVFDTRTCGARGVAGCTPVATFDVDRSQFVLAALYPRTYQLNTRTHVH